MTREMLGAEDAAWLHMEDPTNPMVVNGVIELEGSLSVAEIMWLLDEHVARLPRFRARVLEPNLHVGVPRWVEDESFDLARHVEHVELGTDDAALCGFVGRRVSELLPRDRPLWKIYVIDRQGRGTALLFRVHHAIADGFALLGVLFSICEGDVSLPKGPPPDALRGRRRGVVDHALAAARLVTLPPDPKTPLKGPLSTEKRVAWSEPLDLERVKAIAHATSSTVNDVLMATVAGALRRYLLPRATSLSEIHAMVPVNLRHETPTSLANDFGLVVVGLPVDIDEPLARLSAMKRRMDDLKKTPEAIVALAILRAMGSLPRTLEQLGVEFFGKKGSLIVTNVPGPRERIRVAGIPVSRFIFWVPQSGRMGLGVSIFSYAGEVTLGVMSDAGLVPDPEDLVAAIHVEIAALEARARHVSPVSEARDVRATSTG